MGNDRIELDDEQLVELKKIIESFNGATSFFGFFKKKGVLEKLVQASNGIGDETKLLEGLVKSLKTNTKEMQNLSDQISTLVRKQLSEATEELNNNLSSHVNSMILKLEKDIRENDEIYKAFSDIISRNLSKYQS